MSDDPGGTSVAADDNFALMLRFTNGAIGEILTSWALDVEGNRQFEVSIKLVVANRRGVLAQVLPKDTSLATRFSRNIQLNLPLVSAAMAPA